jgi:membrane protease YdiL (CAAX protease family)
MIKNLLFFLQSGEIKETDRGLSPAFFARLYFLKFGLLVLYILTMAFFYGFEFFQGMESKANNSIFLTFLNFVILAPVLEELIFRNHLNLKPINLILSGLILLFLFWGDGFIFVMLGYFSLVWFLRNRNGPKTTLFLIYLSSLLFGFSHYYQIIDWSNMETILMFILRSVPHVLSGIILSYLYFRNGILVAISFHALWNLMPFLSTWLDRVL